MSRLYRYGPGLLLISFLTVIALFLAQYGNLAHYGLSPLTLSILFGVLLGNIRPKLPQGVCQSGLRLSQKNLLRIGVALYGFNLSVQQIAQVGRIGIGVDILMVVSTLAIGWWIGTRLLGLDRETALLTSAGSAICGAAAIVATAPVLSDDGDMERVVDKTATAVATVVLFGTLSMVLYPVLYSAFASGHSGFGIYVGSTVHEVAQVVAIGNIIGHGVAGPAVIVKMIRVMLLVPFLLLMSGLSKNSRGARGRIVIPWFAVMFVVFAGVNSLGILPDALVQALRQGAVILLTAAMGALGLDTTFHRLRQTGLRAFLLGLCLFVHLVAVGGLLNYWLAG